MPKKTENDHRQYLTNRNCHRIHVYSSHFHRFRNGLLLRFCAGFLHLFT
nr:MAG TPA: hypothetical protein [Caudoviricetes sp.]